MKKYTKLAFWIAVVGLIVAIASWYLRQYPIPVLQPAGVVAHQERQLIIICIAISLVVVLPVFGMLAFVSLRYRESNKKATYRPDQDGSAVAEAAWWLLPTVIMVFISSLIWRSTYALDPYKPLDSNKDTLHIQVVALDWKWLFIYPDKHIASVNQAVIPVDTPVDFTITSDTVMNSFWVPALGGQMYAMPGMITHLNLSAQKLGDFNGSAANISGDGFAKMRFTVRSVSDTAYRDWVKNIRIQPTKLTQDAYTQLAKPGVPSGVQSYGSVTSGLYDTIMMKYMMPMDTETQESALLPGAPKQEVIIT